MLEISPPLCTQTEWLGRSTPVSSFPPHWRYVFTHLHLQHSGSLEDYNTCQLTDLSTTYILTLSTAVKSPSGCVRTECRRRARVCFPLRALWAHKDTHPRTLQHASGLLMNEGDHVGVTSVTGWMRPVYRALNREAGFQCRDKINGA